MYKEKTICVVVPCFNEQTQIAKVLKTIPDYIDNVVVIDDHSTDKTVEEIESFSNIHEKIVLIKHKTNKGVGGSIETGYIWARDNGVDVAVVMAGDGQMDPDDLPKLLDPIVDGKVDYAKGNRLFTGEAYKKIPKLRYFGNSILSLLTKIASGYWHVADSQCGYTAINKKALRTIEWGRMYKRYGQPNQLLTMLNIYNFKVRDVPVKPIYGVGEKSGIKIRKVVFTISYLLLKNFLWRMKEKYIIRDFHPLVFFYFLGLFLFPTGLIFGLYLFFLKIIYAYDIASTSALFSVFLFVSGLQSLFFAMWFDMESNKELK